MRRRVAAGLGAFILMAALVAFPLRARAMSAAAVAASVGGATLIAAYMAACGIYPYSEDGQSFGEWGARALTDLVEQYNQNCLERQIQIAQLTGYVAGRTIAIARDTWDKLRQFVQWIVDKFSLTDNQTGVNVGAVSFFTVPFGSYDSALSSGNLLCLVSTSISDSPVGGFLTVGENNNMYYFWWVTASNNTSRTFLYSFPNDYGSISSQGKEYISGVGYSYVARGTLVYLTTSDVSFAPGLSIFDNYYDGISAFAGGGSSDTTSITLDTSTVSIPAELPEDDDTEWVGLSVYPGTVTGVAGTGTITETGAEIGTGAVAGTENPATVLTPQAVERIIQQGVEARQRPDVRPVEVEVGEGVTVDEETGELVAAEPGTVVITETDIPLSLGDYAIPSLSTVFPFSIPWDIMRVWQALDAEPRFPLQDFSMTLSVPWLFGDSPPTVRFGLDVLGPEVAQKMDELAFMVRSFLLVIACVGFLIFISQFIKF